MNKYELALVFKSTLSDEARNTELEKVKGFITSKSGVIKEVENVGTKKLAYEIQKMKEGYYYFVKFEATGDVIQNVENNCRITDTLLRYLVLKDERPEEVKKTVKTETKKVEKKEEAKVEVKEQPKKEEVKAEVKEEKTEEVKAEAEEKATEETKK